MYITESNNENTRSISECSTIDMVRMINEEDTKVAYAVEKELSNIADAVDKASAMLKHGGRMFYVGTGTSGRIGVLDASECPATYSVPEGMVKAILAGGINGITNASNGDEDSYETGVTDISNENITNKDVVIGLTASGRTPYVLGALEYARNIGALTIGICNNPDSEIIKYSDITIAAITGPEVIQGSTRMKAGTSQKMILNMISTGVMIKMGKTYKNIMVDLNANNKKLYERAENMVCNITGVSKDKAESVLRTTGYKVRDAIYLIENGDKK